MAYRPSQAATRKKARKVLASEAEQIRDIWNEESGRKGKARIRPVRVVR